MSTPALDTGVAGRFAKGWHLEQVIRAVVSSSRPLCCQPGAHPDSRIRTAALPLWARRAAVDDGSHSLVLSHKSLPYAYRPPMTPYARNSASAAELIQSFLRNRSLIWQLTKREFVGRYRGSFLGIAWSFFFPLMMLAVYTFVFSVVFRARWGIGGEESKASFAIVLFVGLIVHGLFAEVINRAPTLVLTNVTYVKRVVFPLEVLPWVVMGSALLHAGISLFVLLLAQAVLTQQFHWTSVLFPLVVAPLILSTMGLAWLLAATGVYLRDIGQAVGIVTTVMMFLAPVFYPLSALPEQYQPLLYLNPLTFVIEEGRRVLLIGELPNWAGLMVYLAISLLVAWAGFGWFQKTRKGFADVL